MNVPLQLKLLYVSAYYRRDRQGFVIGYDIEILIYIFFIYNKAILLQGKQHLVFAQLNGHFW